MRRVDFDPAALTGEDRELWDKWQARADAATEKAIAAVEAGQPFEFNNAVWSDLKKFLIERVFYGKCAYCETPITAGFVGDAEHYRPKGKVTYASGDEQAEAMWGDKPHPGYYWLAYDWRNLFPTCSNCNSQRGKMTQFPVAGTYVGSHTPPPTDPASLDEVEKPLLLNPYRKDHDPFEHLVFIDKGMVACRTPLGENSVKVFHLNREPLRVARQTAQEVASVKVLSVFINSIITGQSEESSIADIMKPFVEGKEAYSAAALSALPRAIARAQEAIAKAMVPNDPAADG